MVREGSNFELNLLSLLKRRSSSLNAVRPSKMVEAKFSMLFLLGSINFSPARFVNTLGCTHAIIFWLRYKFWIFFRG
ncbi:hypothetical protein BpHYR1_045736 [Brachionus plicatilis]|uniref:Uncharacterized protein n=1 Tax=Brachionus plicatilis TaxID=10195 RepID=A0A3M7PX52_BRAPC|nr:hypothetical protein BpHYR1_045736 [Brachionus plicatilis]